MKVGTAPFGAFPLLHARFPNLRPYKGAFHEGNDPLRTGVPGGFRGNAVRRSSVYVTRPVPLGEGT